MTKTERRAYYRNLSVSAAQQERDDRRRAFHKLYERTHYTTVGCRVPKATAVEFANLCKRHGKTPYRAIQDAIVDALRQDAARLAGDAPPFR